MREIKFRGMDDNGAMRYGQLSQDKPHSTIYYAEYSQRICWGDSNIPVSNKSLGQFTGLTDKNGKEIYEGDILQPCHFTKSSFLTMEVIFCEGTFKLKTGASTLRESLHKSARAGNHYIVIGNIYENPSLLGKGD